MPRPGRPGWPAADHGGAVAASSSTSYTGPSAGAAGGTGLRDSERRSRRASRSAGPRTSRRSPVTVVSEFRARTPSAPRDLGVTDVVLAVERLSVEVGQFDDIRVDAVQPPHSGGHQVPCGSSRYRRRRPAGPGRGAAHLRVPGTLPRLKIHPAAVASCPAVALLFPLGQLRRRRGTASSTNPATVRSASPGRCPGSNRIRVANADTSATTSAVSRVPSIASTSVHTSRRDPSPRSQCRRRRSRSVCGRHRPISTMFRLDRGRRIAYTSSSRQSRQHRLLRKQQSLTTVNPCANSWQERIKSAHATAPPEGNAVGTRSRSVRWTRRRPPAAAVAATAPDRLMRRTRSLA